jgi:DNA-directed RNA polymerase subunit beta'
VDQEDCGTLNGVTVEALVEAGEEVESLQDRIVGRTALEDIRVPGVSKKVIVRAHEGITEETAEEIVKYGIDSVRIRSVLTCESRRGVCVRCYGRNLATGKAVQLGDAVGIIAAQSIGEPGTQLTMRTFHVGGIASGPMEQSHVEVKNTGKVQYRDLETATDRRGSRVVISRGAEVAVVDDKGKELERHPAPTGAAIHFKDAQRIKKNSLLLEWDPYIRSIITETKGAVKYEDMVEDVTMREERDPTTGVIEQVIIPHKEDLHPQISILGKKKKVLAFYPIPSGAHIVVEDGEKVEAGDVLAKTPRQISKTKDITGGLPRVAELFEARKPKEPAIISHIDGVVELSSSGRGMRKIKIMPKVGKEREYIIPHGKHLNVHTGDRVSAGQRLIDGPVVPQDILGVRGEDALRRYLLEEIQDVYRLQGVKINAKHIEIIIRQMLRKIRIESAGDTSFLANEEVDKVTFREENERVAAEGGEPATAEPLLLGITKASLGTESFIAAASFQQTTRVLTDAAMRGKEDKLRGLKENVIIGHLIPAGTGSTHYKDTDFIVEEPGEEDDLSFAEEEEAEEAVA